MMISFLNALPGSMAQGLIWGILGLGVAISYQILDYADLTVDGSFATGGAVCAVSLIAGYPAAVAVLFAAIAGMIAGFVTGTLHTRLKIPAILAGILSQLALYSVNMRIMGKSNLTISRMHYSLLLSSAKINHALGVSSAIAAVFVLCLVWFFRTELGFAVRVTGNNEKMARAQGIDTNAMKGLGLILSNGLVGISGALLAQYQGNADINMGRGAIVIGLAAVVIGSRLIRKQDHFFIRFTATLCGSMAYYIVLSIVIYLGLSTVDLKLFSALFVAIFLAAPHWKRRVHSC